MVIYIFNKDIAIIENFSLTEGLIMIEKHKLFKNYSDE